VLIKVTAGYGAEPWLILDSKRNTFNVTDNYLHPNNNAAEASLYYQLDLLSNGFKLRNASAASNATGASYIYAAFAEAPEFNLYGAQSNAR